MRYQYQVSETYSENVRALRATHAKELLKDRLSLLALPQSSCDEMLESTSKSDLIKLLLEGDSCQSHFLRLG